MPSLKNLTYTDYSLIQKLFPGKREDFLQSLMSDYREKGYAVVNYLYFASAMKYRLFEWQENSRDIQYSKALRSSSFFMPDGIALQIFAFVVRMITRSKSSWWVHNLNGTDLNPYIFQELPKYGTTSVYLYNLYDPRIGKTKDWIDRSVVSFQAKFPDVRLLWNYAELHQERGKYNFFDELTSVVLKDQSKYKLFFNCTGSPFQEIWVQENIDFFKRNNFIVLNVGGTIDYISGFEKRAPHILVRLRVFEAIWRVLINPKKNLPKFLPMFGVFQIIGKTLLGGLMRVFAGK